MLMPMYSSYNSSTPVTAAFTASAVTGSSATAYTFSSQALGTAGATRMIVINVTGSSNSGGATPINTLTVAGVSAVKAKEQVSSGEAGYSQDIWYAPLASGTSGDVVVTFSGAQARCGIGLMAVYDADDSPTFTNGNSDDPMVATISCPAKGIIIGSCTMNADEGVPTTTWTNLTEKYDQQVESIQSHSGAFATFDSAQTDLTITSNPNVAVSRRAMPLAAWGPAGDAAPEYITLASSDWQGDTGSASLGAGTVSLTAGDKNIRTADALIPAGVDFDFEATFATTSGSQAMGITDNGTGTGAMQPTTTNPIFTARNAGGDARGWQNGNSTVEAGKSAGWFGGNTIGFSRRGAVIYGLIDGSLDRTFSGATTSKAVKFFFGSSGSGAWDVGATNVRYRRGGGLPDIS